MSSCPPCSFLASLAGRVLSTTCSHDSLAFQPLLEGLVGEEPLIRTRTCAVQEPVKIAIVHGRRKIHPQSLEPLKLLELVFLVELSEGLDSSGACFFDVLHGNLVSHLLGVLPDVGYHNIDPLSELGPNRFENFR
jgi:hypothetical protein